jgi:hypothetical protein
MRVNLLIESTSPSNAYFPTLPIEMTIRPACGLPGDYLYPTDSASLLKLLHKSTDLPAYVLDRFDRDLHASRRAKLLGVELDEKTLTSLGYFID